MALIILYCHLRLSSFYAAGAGRSAVASTPTKYAFTPAGLEQLSDMSMSTGSVKSQLSEGEPVADSSSASMSSNTLEDLSVGGEIAPESHTAPVCSGLWSGHNATSDSCWQHPLRIC